MILCICEWNFAGESFMRIVKFLLSGFLVFELAGLSCSNAEGIAEKILDAKKRMGELEVQQTKIALQLAQEGQNLRQIENNAMLDTQNFITSEKDKAMQLKNAIDKINVLEKQQTDLQKQIQELTKVISDTKAQQRRLQKQELDVNNEIPAEKAHLVENDNQNSSISEEVNSGGMQTKTDKLEKLPGKDAKDNEKPDKDISEQIAGAAPSSEKTIKYSSDVSASKTPSANASSSEEVKTDDVNQSADDKEEDTTRTSADETMQEANDTIADAEKVINDAEEQTQSEGDKRSDSDISEKSSDEFEEN